ncbi:MAG: hypothetical protein ACYTBJ_00315 [Planctomycetota bacterium]|jgi:hypothetical protein
MGKLRHDPIPCVVCSAPIYDWGVGTRANQTCTSPECRAEILLHPYLADPARQSGQYPKGKWKHRPDRTSVTTLLAEHSIGLSETQIENLIIGALELKASTEWGSDDWGTLKDERGIDVPDAQANIWSWLSRKSVMLKAVGHKEGQASLVIRKKPRQKMPAVIQKSLGIRMRHTELCDVFYAWRCPCPQDHQIQYETIDDVPSSFGYHDPCPRCGAAPLEVINNV